MGNTDIQGGIIWEPQFQKVIQEGSATYRTLALTNDVFPDHACCVIAMNHDWLKDNSTVAVKFLAGYIKAVDFINNAKKNTSGADYADLVTIAKSSTVGLSDAEVTVALTNITYLYADDDEGSLSGLTDGIGTLADDLKDLGIITSDKFKSGEKFAKAFVDDKYLKDAVAGKASKEGTDSITVAAINGDIHQIAIQVAVAKGYFTEYGLTVTLNTNSSSGGEVIGLLISGDVKIGFLGAPPATLKMINGEHIIA
jgi:ABC-type nitrate/sulfonate/bicarbonate transport system substrate-binding protein